VVKGGAVGCCVLQCVPWFEVVGLGRFVCVCWFVRRSCVGVERCVCV